MKGQQVERSKGQNDTSSIREAWVGRFRGDLPQRTFAFACSIVDLIDLLPANVKGWSIGRQLIQCGTSIGANVAEADQAKSDAEFIQRCSITRKEAAETSYWLNICFDRGILPPERVKPLLTEANEILRILCTIIRKSQQHSP